MEAQICRFCNKEMIIIGVIELKNYYKYVYECPDHKCLQKYILVEKDKNNAKNR